MGEKKQKGGKGFKGFAPVSATLLDMDKSRAQQRKRPLQEKGQKRRGVVERRDMQGKKSPF